MLLSKPNYTTTHINLPVINLFNLASLAETVKSILLSPISTMIPPRISGLTLLETRSFLPSARLDFWRDSTILFKADLSKA